SGSGPVGASRGRWSRLAPGFPVARLAASWNAVLALAVAGLCAPAQAQEKPQPGTTKNDEDVVKAGTKDPYTDGEPKLMAGARTVPVGRRPAHHRRRPRARRAADPVARDGALPHRLQPRVGADAGASGPAQVPARRTQAAQEEAAADRRQAETPRPVAAPPPLRAARRGAVRGVPAALLCDRRRLRRRHRTRQGQVPRPAGQVPAASVPEEVRPRALSRPLLRRAGRTQLPLLPQAQQPDARRDRGRGPGGRRRIRAAVAHDLLAREQPGDQLPGLLLRAADL